MEGFREKGFDDAYDPITYRQTSTCGLDGSWDTALNWPSHPCERIRDEMPKMRRYGNCVHNKIIPSLNRAACSWRDDGSPLCVAGEENVGADRVNTLDDRSYFLNNLTPPQPGSYDWNQLDAEAFVTMKPSLSSGFSLVNFVAELTEVKMLFRLYSRNKTLIQNAAGANLNWNLGWKPLLGDLETMYGLLNTWRSKLEKYKSQQGRPLVRHFMKTLHSATDESYTNSGFHTATCSRKRDAVYHATLRYSYVVPQLQSEHAEVKALLDMLGLKASAYVVWNAIPFSFVVDWFVKVGDYLQSRQPDYLDSKVTILDYCASIKEVVMDEMSIIPAGSTTSNPTLDLGTCVHSYYTRRRRIPLASDYGIVTSNKAGTKQLLLAASLLVA